MNAREYSEKSLPRLVTAWLEQELANRYVEPDCESARYHAANELKLRVDPGDPTCWLWKAAELAVNAYNRRSARRASHSPASAKSPDSRQPGPGTQANCEPSLPQPPSAASELP